MFFYVHCGILKIIISIFGFFKKKLSHLEIAWDQMVGKQPIKIKVLSLITQKPVLDDLMSYISKNISTVIKNIKGTLLLWPGKRTGHHSANSREVNLSVLLFLNFSFVQTCQFWFLSIFFPSFLPLSSRFHFLLFRAQFAPFLCEFVI